MAIKRTTFENYAKPTRLQIQNAVEIKFNGHLMQDTSTTKTLASFMSDWLYQVQFGKTFCSCQSVSTKQLRENKL